ncbi:response regulator [Enterobacteriaceae bacterium C23F]
MFNSLAYKLKSIPDIIGISSLPTIVGVMVKTVLIADDHPVCLLGLKTLLNTRKDLYNIVHESMNSDDVMMKLAIQPVDIIITDLCMPGIHFPDGITMVRKLVRDYPQCLIVVVTMITNPGLLATIRSFGVKVLSKSSLLTDLLQTLRSSSRSMKRVEKPTTQLTQKETEVVRLLLSGMTVNEISCYFNRTKQTISAQKKSAMYKLGAANDFELFQCAQSAGLGTEVNMSSATKSTVLLP